MEYFADSPEDIRRDTETVASAMGVSVQTVQHWEKTMKFRYAEDLRSLLDHYDVDCDVRKAVIWEVYGNGDCPCDVGLKILETG